MYTVLTNDVTAHNGAERRRWSCSATWQTLSSFFCFFLLLLSFFFSSSCVCMYVCCVYLQFAYQSAVAARRPASFREENSLFGDQNRPTGYTRGKYRGDGNNTNCYERSFAKEQNRVKKIISMKQRMIERSDLDVFPQSIVNIIHGKTQCIQS